MLYQFYLTLLIVHYITTTFASRCVILQAKDPSTIKRKQRKPKQSTSTWSIFHIFSVFLSLNQPVGSPEVMTPLIGQLKWNLASFYFNCLSLIQNCEHRFLPSPCDLSQSFSHWPLILWLSSFQYACMTWYYFGPITPDQQTTARYSSQPLSNLLHNTNKQENLLYWTQTQNRRLNAVNQRNTESLNVCKAGKPKYKNVMINRRSWCRAQRTEMTKAKKRGEVINIHK